MMKTLLLVTLCAIAVVQARADNTVAVLSLVGREFSIHDDWAGQELAFRRYGDSIRAVWRILGSGVPVVSEVESSAEVKNPRVNVFEVLFEVQLRDKSRGRLKVELGEKAAVRIYLNGVRIDFEEKRAEPVARANGTRCHDLCMRRARASERRGSSLTLGRSPWKPALSRSVPGHGRRSG